MYRPGMAAKESIKDTVETMLTVLPEQLGTPEIIAGCEVTDLDPTGAGALPRYVEVRIQNYKQLALWRGTPVIAVGCEVTVVHSREGNRYEVTTISGDAGAETPGDLYLRHWVYDVSEGLLIPYTTINGALSYGLLASGDYVFIHPGTFDESITLADGVIITEMIPGTVIIDYDGDTTAMTAADGGYIQVKEIKVTRGAGDDIATVDLSTLGVGESCEIRAELIGAVQTGATANEVARAITGGGNGTVYIYANLIEAHMTSAGGGDMCTGIYIEDDTVYVFSDVAAYSTGGAIQTVSGVTMDGSGYCYLRGHTVAEGDEFCAAFLIFDNTEMKVWGDGDARDTIIGGVGSGVEIGAGSFIIYGNLSAITTGEPGAIYDGGGSGNVEVYGNCYAKETGGVSTSCGVYCDGSTIRTHGDVIAEHSGGGSVGIACEAGTMTATCGRVSGSIADLSRVGGTLQVFMVEFDTYDGAITNYYPGVDDFWIGLAGGAGARITFDDQATDVINFVDAYVGVNEAAPQGQHHVTCPADDAIGQIVEAATGHTVNISEWWDDAHNVLGAVQCYGAAYFNKGESVTNTFVGYEAGQSNTVTGIGNQGLYNAAYGYRSLGSNTTGYSNSAFGVNALLNNTTGYSNSAFGFNALFSNTTGNSNSAFGRNALRDNVSGDFNTILGYDTGRGITTGNYNTIVGAQVVGLAAGLSNRVILADGQGNIYAYWDNNGNCAIGNGETTPDRKLHVVTEDTVPAAITYAGRLTHECSTPATGLANEGGVGLELELETATDGMNRVATTIESIWSDAAAATSRARIHFRADYQDNEVLVGVIEAPERASIDGNARGSGAVDLQGYRTAADHVASGNNSALVAGWQNEAAGIASGCLAGVLNTITANEAGCLAGSGNTISAQGAASVGGSSCIASGARAVVMGEEALADKQGQVVNASGYFDDFGDAQGTIQICAKLAQASHAVNTWYALYPDGGALPVRITIAASTCWTVHIKLVGITADCAQRWSYIVEGNIYRDNVNNTAVDTSSLTTIFESDVNYEAQIAADDVNEALEVQVRRTGGVDYDVYWVATISMVEVTRTS